MTKFNDNSFAEQDLKSLEQRVDELIHACQQLKQENRDLRIQQHELVDERITLLEKTELAKTRVEAMISRLKNLETGS